MPTTSPRRQSKSVQRSQPWSADTEIVGITLQLQPVHDSTLYPQYTIGLHAWLLDQARQYDPELSAYLHDGESEKPFTISALQGITTTAAGSPQLKAQATYTWTITALSQPVAAWLATWLQALPTQLELRGAPLRILDWDLSKATSSHPATTYDQLFEQSYLDTSTLKLSFLSPTSFRRRGNHFPLPVPINLFHSYLRRWNDFSGIEFESEDFLDWIEESVLIQQHQLQSIKIVAGKKGSVTGFTGAIELGLARVAYSEPEYVKLFWALGRFAPYCGTGHKTTFGLGQTQSGWAVKHQTEPIPALQTLLADRIAELTQIFIAQRKRTGGNRATQIAETWATILARRDLGESLMAIADDLEMPYLTVKTYAKLARQELRKVQSASVSM
jgi:CRISPR-associated endoribonuclease Cas6